jgi:uncharacterized membrane protein YfcA
MIFIGFLCLLGMGMILGLMGSGGSILTIPILIYAFNTPILLATTYSFIILGSCAAAGAVRFHKDIIFKRTIHFIVSSLTGVSISRAYILPNLPPEISGIAIEHILLWILTTSMLFAGALMVKGTQSHEIDFIPSSISERVSVMILGLCLGLFIGLIGAGGGFLIIPVLVMRMKLPMRQAIATSLTLLALNAIMGILSDPYDMQNSDWIVVFQYVAASLMGMKIGMTLSQYVCIPRLKIFFGYFILLTAIGIMFKEYTIRYKI